MKLLLLHFFALLIALPSFADEFKFGSLSNILSCPHGANQCSTPETALETKTIALNENGTGELTSNFDIKGSRAATIVKVQKQGSFFEITILAGWGAGNNGYYKELDKYLVKSSQEIKINTYYGPKAVGAGVDYIPFITMTPPLD